MLQLTLTIRKNKKWIKWLENKSLASMKQLMALWNAKQALSKRFEIRNELSVFRLDVFCTDSFDYHASDLETMFD